MSRRDKEIQRWIGVDFAKWLDKTKAQRIVEGTDNKQVSDARLTNALVKDPDSEILRKRLVRMKRKEELR